MLSPLTKYYCRCFFYIYILNLLSRSLAPNVQGLRPTPPPSLCFLLSSLSWAKETSNTVLEMCVGNVSFPTCPSVASGGTDSTANSYPNKSGLEKKNSKLELSEYCFLARSNKTQRLRHGLWNQTANIPSCYFT